MYKVLYDPATLPSSVVSVPSPILFLVGYTLATTLVSLVEHTRHAAASGPLLILFSLSGISFAQDSYHKLRAPLLLSGTLRQCLLVQEADLIVPESPSKTASLPSYHSLSYLHTLLFFFYTTYLHLMSPVCLLIVCLLSRAGPLSVLFTVVSLVPGSS